VLVIPVGQLEQVVAGLLFVRQDEGTHALAVGDAPVKASLDVGGTSLLPALEDDRAHAAGGCALLLDLRVNQQLGLVHHERYDCPLLRPDLQAAWRVVQEVVPQAPPY
jgi:hypothetical protein